MEYEEIVKPTIYLTFTGLGKTYFCQHNLGWIDLDEEPFLRNRIMPALYTAVKCYIQYGYKVITNASIETIRHLRDKCNFIIILPEDTDEEKEFVLNNIMNRDYGKKYKVWIQQYYDRLYKDVKSLLTAEDEVFYLKPGMYLSDILKNS